MKISRIVAGVVGFAFLCNTVLPGYVWAQDFRLPAPGSMVALSPQFEPPVLRGIKVNLNNPFHFDFIMDKGDSALSDSQLKDESNKLIKYFLAGVTTPEKDLWVNLSPYEKDRIVPEAFGKTEMGRDLLAEDYILKQITASLLYPEGETGKKFWKRIYEETAQKFGTTMDIPVDTFNKVWIAPEKAVIYENTTTGTAYVTESRLKVMLEQDYVSLQNHEGIGSVVPPQNKEASQLGGRIVREIIIPALVKEVNEGQNFAQLRQVYNSLILSTWYKKKVKDGILSRVYANQNKVAGVSIDDPAEKQRIYSQYLQAFEKGVYNYVKEEINPVSRESVPRKYFSGGTNFTAADMDRAMDVRDLAESSLAAIKRNMKKGVETLMIIAAGIVVPSLQAQTVQAENVFSTKIEASGFKGQTWTFNHEGDEYVGRMTIMAPPPYVTNTMTGKTSYVTSMDPYYSYDDDYNVIMPSGPISLGLQEFLPANQAVVLLSGKTWPIGQDDKLFINPTLHAGYRGNFTDGSIVTEENSGNEYWVAKYYGGRASGDTFAKLYNPELYVQQLPTPEAVNAAATISVNSPVSVVKLTKGGEFFAFESSPDNFMIGKSTGIAPAIYSNEAGVKYYTDNLTPVEFVNGKPEVIQGKITGDFKPFSAETFSRELKFSGFSQQSGVGVMRVFRNGDIGVLGRNFAVDSFATQINVFTPDALLQVNKSDVAGSGFQNVEMTRVVNDIAGSKVTFQSSVQMTRTPHGYLMGSYYNAANDVTYSFRVPNDGDAAPTLRLRGNDGVVYTAQVAGSDVTVTPTAFVVGEGGTKYLVSLDGGATTELKRHQAGKHRQATVRERHSPSVFSTFLKAAGVYFIVQKIADIVLPKSVKEYVVVNGGGSNEVPMPKPDNVAQQGPAGNVDNAGTVDTSSTGGIDLTAEQMNLQLQNAGKQIEFRVDPAMLAQLQNVAGFTSNVIGMQLMTEASLRQFLGI